MKPGDIMESKKYPLKQDFYAYMIGHDGAHACFIKHKLEAFSESNRAEVYYIRPLALIGWSDLVWL